MTIAAVFTLVMGIVAGFLGQRSRLCFVGGIRDWILVRDTALLKGLLAFALTAWIAFPLASRMAEHVELPLPRVAATGDTRTALAYAIPGGEVTNGATARPSSGDAWPAPRIPLVALLFVGGLGLGLCSVMAGGCPLRQHILAGQGRGSAVFYLLGFYAGALAFETLVAPVLERIVR